MVSLGNHCEMAEVSLHHSQSIFSLSSECRCVLGELSLHCRCVVVTTKMPRKCGLVIEEPPYVSLLLTDDRTTYYPQFRLVLIFYVKMTKKMKQNQIVESNLSLSIFQVFVTSIFMTILFSIFYFCLLFLLFRLLCFQFGINMQFTFFLMVCR